VDVSRPWSRPPVNPDTGYPYGLESMAWVRRSGTAMALTIERRIFPSSGVTESRLAA